MYNFRTDLALERRDIYRKANKLEEIPGINTEEENVSDKIKITRVIVKDQNGEEAIGKPIGTYVTIDVKKLRSIPDEEIERISETLSKEIKKLVDKHVDSKGETIIIGLGNLYMSPDSLRPKSSTKYRCYKTYY